MASANSSFLVKTVIWDWNGTLLDDRELCVDIMNRLLTKYGLPKMSLETYLNKFTFPIRNYYRSLGFHEDLVPFERVATEFIEMYEEEKFSAPLRPDAMGALEAFSRKGQTQYILSASKQGSLDTILRHHRIEKYFKAAYGLRDHYAHGKATIGREMILDEKLDPKYSLFIGDTVHDAEVARETGIPCVLVQGGHNSNEKIQYCGCGVFRGLRFIPHFFH